MIGRSGRNEWSLIIKELLGACILVKKANSLDMVAWDGVASRIYVIIKA